MRHDPSAFGQCLRELRTAASLSQEALAERAGLSQRGISDLERGVRRAPHLTTVRLLADALALTPTDRERLVAAARPGRSAETPPDSLARSPNLPRPLTALIGRELEVAELAALLGRSDVRLVTLTGPGGVGKTRLALEVGAQVQGQFGDGVVFIDLAPLTDSALVPAAMMAALGVREVGGQPAVHGLIAFLRERNLLLVLDNVEHLLPAAPVASDLLQACPTVKLLATSRAPLHLRGEHEFLVLPLEVPDPNRDDSREQVRRFAAVQLFVERAQASMPDFALTDGNGVAIAEICRRLDGLPLAIELAAARSKLLPPHALLERLGERLVVLTSGARDAPARQRTLRDAIAWSHDLLGGEEQILFRRLAVFAGGCAVEAVEAVTNAEGTFESFEGIATLVDESLLRQVDERGENPRFAMMETIQEFAWERLAASGETGVMRQRHAAHFAALAEELRPLIDGRDQLRVIAQLETEHDNFRAALAWAIERADAATALRLTANLWKFWLVRSWLTEGLDWLERSLSVPGDAPTTWRVDALYGAGSFARLQGDYQRATALGEEGLALARESGDTLRSARSMYLLGLVAHYQGDRARAQVLYEEALGLAREVHDTHIEAMLLNNLGDAIAAQCDTLEPQHYYEEALAIWRTRVDKWGMGIALLNLSDVALRTGDLGRARDHLREGLLMSLEIGDERRIADYLDALGRLAAATGQWLAATRLLGAATARYQTIGIEQFPDHRGEHEQAVAAARAGLGDAAFTTSWNEGQLLLPDEAVTIALSIANAPISGATSQPREKLTGNAN